MVPEPAGGRPQFTLPNAIDVAQCQQDGDRSYALLNTAQKAAADAILAAADGTSPDRLIYLDGPGGSGKTFLTTCVWNLLAARGKKVTPRINVTCMFLFRF